MTINLSPSPFLCMLVELQQRVLDFCDSPAAAILAVTHSAWLHAARRALYHEISFELEYCWVTDNRRRDTTPADALAQTANAPRYITRLRQLAWTVATNQSLADSVRVLDISIYTRSMRGKEVRDILANFCSCLQYMTGLRYLFVPVFRVDSVILEEFTYFLSHHGTTLRGLKLGPLPDDDDFADEIYDAILDLAERSDANLQIVALDFWDGLPAQLEDFAAVPVSVMCYDDMTRTLGRGEPREISLHLSPYAASSPDLDSHSRPIAGLEKYLRDVDRALEERFFLPISESSVNTLHLYLVPEDLHRGILRHSLDVLVRMRNFREVETLQLHFCLEADAGPDDRLSTADLLAAVVPMANLKRCYEIVFCRNNYDSESLHFDKTPSELAIALGEVCPSLDTVSYPPDMEIPVRGTKRGGPNTSAEVRS